MHTTGWTIVVVLASALALVVAFGRFGRLLGNAHDALHEFAYGAPLPASHALVRCLDQFLSLPDLDSNQIQIEMYFGISGSNSLKPLIRHISALGQEFADLTAALKKADELVDQKQKALEAVKLLIPYKDRLKNEAEQDKLIIFVHYCLKQPFEIPPAERARISRLVRQLDTTEQSDEFDSGQCPAGYLRGNVNLYPLNLDNTCWHSMVRLNAPDSAPIIEIRFMGLRGIFRYLLDEMSASTGLAFQHLDGERL
jgi:hypothetical protein